MTQFIVKGRVKYNGKVYTSGAVVEVADKDVTEFKKHGWEIVKGKAPKQEDDKVVFTKNTKKELIVAELQKRGIVFDETANKADLLALLA